MRSRGLLGLLASAALLAGACDGDADPPDSPGTESLRLLEETEARLVEVTAQLERTRRELNDERDESRRLQEQLESLSAAADGPREGSVVTIPLLGELRWRCNDRAQVGYTFLAAQASVTVLHSVNGDVSRDVAHSQNDVRGAYEEPGTHQEWTILYRHKPGTISAQIVPLAAPRHNGCYVRSFSVEQSRRPSF